jgi:hypothetical protein
LHPAAPYDGAYQKLPNRQLFRIAHNEAGDKIDRPIRCVTVEYLHQGHEIQSPWNCDRLRRETRQGIAAAVVPARQSTWMVPRISSLVPNPHQERKITNFHRNLVTYMGTRAPRLLK